MTDLERLIERQTAREKITHLHGNLCLTASEGQQASEDCATLLAAFRQETAGHENSRGRAAVEERLDGMPDAKGLAPTRTAPDEGRLESAATPPNAAWHERLRALAQNQARHQHDRRSAAHGDGEHFGLFDTCAHPDCLLVRQETPSLSTQEPDKERANLEMGLRAVDRINAMTPDELRAVIRELEAAKASSPSPTSKDWQPIETAPKGTVVLLMKKIGMHWIGDWALFEKYNYPKFTHWMPLPSPPSPAPKGGN